MKPEKDDLFKDFLSQVESPGFRKEYWQALESRLDKRGKSRRRMSAIMLVACICLGLAWTMKSYYSSGTAYGNLARTKTKESMPDPGTNNNISAKAKSGTLMPLAEKNLLGPKLKTPASLPVTKETLTEQNDYLIPGQLPLNNETVQTIEVPEEADVNGQLGHMAMPVFNAGNRDGSIALVSPVAVRHPLIRIRKTRHYPFSVDVGVGISNVSGHIQSRAVDNQYYMDRRKNEERDMIVLSPRINLQYETRYGLIAGLGLEYASYGERIGYRAYSMQEEVLKQLHYHMDTIPVYNFTTRTTQWEKDTDIYITYDTVLMEKADPRMGRYASRTNFSYIEIPVFIGYKLSRPSYALSVKAGFSYGKISYRSIRGQYLNTEGTGLVDLSSEKKDISATLSSYSLQFRLSKRLAKRIWIFMEPSFKGNLNPVYSNHFLRQKYTSFGSCFGLSFQY